MCPRCPPFSLELRSSQRSLVPATRSPAENGKAEQEGNANKGRKRPATRALSLPTRKKKEEKDDDDVDSTPATKRRKPKPPPARKGVNVRKKTPATKRRKPKPPPARKVGNVRKKAAVTKCSVTKCYFGCHLKNSKDRRFLYRIPENANVPTNVRKGQRCCQTCYRYWRFLHEPCVFAGHSEYKCRARGSTTARGDKPVPELDHVPKDVRGKRCCDTCYKYWRFLHEPCVFAGHSKYKFHPEGSTARARYKAPTLDDDPDNLSGQRCCQTCYRICKDIQSNELCIPCWGNGRQSGGGHIVHGKDGMKVYMCNTCAARTQNARFRRRKGIQKRKIQGY
jgi:hypothetical protein